MEQSDLTNKYIRTYHNVLTKENCQHLIDKFEDSSSQWVKTDLDNHRHFTEINLNLHKDWQEYATLLFEKCRLLVDKYRKDVKIDSIKQWPEKFGFEQIRFKKYEDNDKDEFREHVDVTDYNSARRFLVIFLYLNKNDGGDTTFTDYNIRVRPEAGKALMFPPLWTYQHTGEKPKNQPKYLVGTYLHYV
jgi:hypothetical protein|tara:strand:- start:21 stop:587 length:567 start_codon:yes stop_codon:yes gene_type:complete